MPVDQRAPCKFRNRKDFVSGRVRRIAFFWYDTAREAAIIVNFITCRKR